MYNRNLAAISEKIASMGHTTCFDCGNVVDAEDIMRQSNCEGTNCKHGVLYKVHFQQFSRVKSLSL